MSILQILVIAFAMSTDAFVAAIGKGAALYKPRFSEALKTGAIFGTIEALTPLIGWGIGIAAVQFVAAFDHWIAFTLLLFLGIHMIHAGFTGDHEEPESRPQKHSRRVLALTAVATSIDALAVGVSMAFVQVNILLAALAIGLATFTMVTIGVMLGRTIGTALGRKAEILGGLVLIAIGVSIVVEHVSAGT